jgi:hypothetical protein
LLLLAALLLLLLLPLPPMCVALLPAAVLLLELPEPGALRLDALLCARARAIAGQIRLTSCSALTAASGCPLLLSATAVCGIKIR